MTNIEKYASVNFVEMKVLKNLLNGKFCSSNRKRFVLGTVHSVQS